MKNNCLWYKFKKINIFIGISSVVIFIPRWQVRAEQVCIVTNTGQVVCGRGYKNTQSLEGAGGLQVRDNDYRVALKGCLRDNSRIKCEFVVTDLVGGDRYFRLWTSRTRMISNYGDEFRPSEVQFGKDKASSAGTTMVANVPIKGSIFFDKIPISVNKIAALEFDYDGAARGPEGKIRFLDINVR
jgi:hypothetical protein